MDTLFVLLSVFVPILLIMLFTYQVSKQNYVVNQKEKNLFWAGSSLSFLNIIMYLIGNAPLSLLASFLIFIFLVIIILTKRNLSIFSLNKYSVTWIFLSINIVFIYFYPTFRAFSPLHQDTYNNYTWIKRNLENGLYNYVYFPGITNITNFSIKIVDPLENLNYFAVALNLLLLLSMNLVLKSILKEESLIVFNLILISIMFYSILDIRLSLLSINLVYYVFICILVVIITRSQELNTHSIQILLILFMLSSGLFSPHITALLAPSIVLALVIVRKSISIRTFIQIIMGLLLSIWLGINYSLKNSGIDYVRNLNVYNNTGTILHNDDATDYELFLKIIQNYLSFKYSIYLSGFNYISIGAIIAYLFTIFCCVYAIRLNSLKLKVISSINLILGFTAMTGIGDLNFIKGRVGIIYMLNTALVVALVFDQVINKKSFKAKRIKPIIFVMVLVVLNFVSNITFLPQMSNKADESVLKVFYNLVKDEPKQKIYVYSNQPYFEVLDRRIEQIEKIESADYVVLNLSNDSDLYKLEYYNQAELSNIQSAVKNRRNIVMEQKLFINNLFDTYSKREDYKIEGFSNNKYVIFSK